MAVDDGNRRARRARMGPKGSNRIQDRFGLLLFLLVASFVALGFSDNTWALVLAGLLQAAAMVVAFVATRIGRDHRIVGLLSAISLIGVVSAGISGDGAGVVEAGASVVLLGGILYGVLDRVLRHRRVTLQTLFGAMCGYFLIGLMFGGIYAALNDASSTPLFGEPVGQSVYSYFSFTTLTTAGFGDYTAKSNLGRRVVAMEAVIGQLFIATTLARLVSLYKAAPSEEPPPAAANPPEP